MSESEKRPRERFKPGAVEVQTDRGRRVVWIESDGRVYRLIRSGRIRGKVELQARQVAREKESRLIKPTPGQIVRPG